MFIHKPVQISQAHSRPAALSWHIQIYIISCYVFCSQFVKRLGGPARPHSRLQTCLLICRHNRLVIQFKAKIITPPTQDCLPLLGPPHLSSPELRGKFILGSFRVAWPLRQKSRVKYSPIGEASQAGGTLRRNVDHEHLNAWRSSLVILFPWNVFVKTLKVFKIQV